MNALQSPLFHVKSNGVMIIVWAGALIPTLLWWRESVVWLVFMSWYANFVGHIGSWLAAKAEQKVDENLTSST